MLCSCVSWWREQLCVLGSGQSLSLTSSSAEAQQLWTGIGLQLATWRAQLLSTTSWKYLSIMLQATKSCSCVSWWRGQLYKLGRDHPLLWITSSAEAQQLWTGNGLQIVTCRVEFLKAISRRNPSHSTSPANNIISVLCPYIFFCMYMYILWPREGTKQARRRWSAESAFARVKEA